MTTTTSPTPTVPGHGLAGATCTVSVGKARPGFAPLSLKGALLWIVLGTTAFHVAYAVPAASALLPLYLMAMWELSRAKTVRWAFRAGFVLGFGIFAPQLAFFWTLFGLTAIVLWMVLSFWTGLFVALARVSRERCPPVVAALSASVLWLAVEYFRSELYYLRFSWINVGYGFAGQLPGPVLSAFGVYGITFAMMALVAGISLWSGSRRWLGAIGIVALSAFLTVVPRDTSTSQPQGTLRVAGVQLEFPSEAAALKALDKLAAKHPDTQLFMLSEYAFDGPVPPAIREWCRQHQRHLLLGAKEPVKREVYYNTAFVIGPTGETVFKQAKRVPIQFMADGLPAPDQQVWDSPWGRLGFCICYDFSYTRVTDGLIRQGAQAILVPTMDVVEWGLHQHQLHARVAPIRAAEYGVPVFRLCSSGISQSVNALGQVEASAPFPGEEEMITGRLNLPAHGSLPLDRWLGPLAGAATGAWLFWLLAMRVKSWQGRG